VTTLRRETKRFVDFMALPPVKRQAP